MKLEFLKPAVLLAALQRRLRFLYGNYRLVLVWPLIALLLGALGWYLLLADLRNERREAEANALHQSEVLARSYSEQLERAVSAIDQIVLQLRYHWYSSDGQLQLTEAKAREAFPPGSPFFLAIFDRDGLLVTSSLAPDERVFKVRREFFTVHQVADRDFLYVGQPITGRITGRIVIPFSRRLEDADGQFDGVVVVFVTPAYFIGSYNEATYGRYGFLGVTGVDSTLRASRTGSVVFPSGPDDLDARRSFPVLENSRLLNGNHWFQDQRDRFVSWKPVSGFPLVAIVGLDQQEVLAPYLANRAAELRDALLATLVLFGFTLIAMALSLRLAWRKHQVEWTRATYRMATEYGSEGFFITQALRGRHGEIEDFEVMDCNQRGAEMFHYRREEMIGKRVSELYTGELGQRVMDVLRQGMRNKRYETEVEAKEGGLLAARWAHLTMVRAEETLALTIRDVSDAKAHMEALERQSNEDALTGLPNRHWVQNTLPEALQAAAAKNAMLAILFIDLDGFKTVNDTMGHSAGDEVLRNAARRLKVAVRPHDRVARLGGDEFVVILENLSLKAEAAHVAERILHAFQDGFHVAGGVHPIGASIGISLFPTDGATANELLHHADIAMYSVKTGGKRNFRFYDPRFYQSLRRRLEKEAELRQAIEHDQFVMHYQPRVDISTGVTSSMEALVRWRHPHKGLLGPQEFIPLAEETDLILRLGELVIDKVCAQLAAWGRHGRELVPVSVNVSSRQMNEVDVARILASTLKRYRITPGLLEVELTESSMMATGADATNALIAIQKMGITLLVDDFGTGYSSLSQLQRLDFDVLKVDRAFTAELGLREEGKVLFSAIITMAHALGMKVVAEGVETLEQVKILKSLKCDEMQGFFISQPLPAAETQPVLPRWFLPSTAT